MDERIRVISRRLIHKGVKFDLEVLRWAIGAGEPIEREVVRHPGSVVVLPLTNDGRMVMIRNFRLSVERELWELPAGTRGQNEDPALCAARELEEETGFRAATLTPLCRFHLSPGMTDELMHVFVGTGLSRVEQRLEPDEAIRPIEMESGAVIRMIKAGEIEDAKTIAVVLMAEQRGLLRS